MGCFAENSGGDTPSSPKIKHYNFNLGENTNQREKKEKNIEIIWMPRIQ
jgi:hypothetical protein